MANLVLNEEQISSLRRCADRLDNCTETITPHQKDLKELKGAEFVIDEGSHELADGMLEIMHSSNSISETMRNYATIAEKTISAMRGGR